MKKSCWTIRPVHQFKKQNVYTGYKDCNFFIRYFNKVNEIHVGQIRFVFISGTIFKKKKLKY